jgi:uncharacterized protein (DUF362 family)
MNSKVSVSIIRTRQNPEYAEIRGAVQEAIRLIGGIEQLIKPGHLVLINPSWVAPPVETEAGCITQPEVTRAIADMVKTLGARPVIAESSAIGVDTQQVIEESGYKDLAEMGYELVDLKKTPSAKLPSPNGHVFQTIDSFQLVQEADVIVSVPKLKTHDQTEMTCSIKKLKGLLTDKAKRAMHQQGLFEGVVDLMSTVRPQLAVVDGIFCQEGLGPIFGKPVEMDLILAGMDLVAVDSVCARLIGYEPEETLLTLKAAERGLGVMNPDQIEILGEDLSQVERRFLRSIEDDPVQVEGFQLIQGDMTCTGCRNTVFSALRDMRRADQLVYLPGITVMTGDAPIPDNAPRDSIVTVGMCVSESSRTDRHARGCPPNNADVVRAIINR